LVRTDQQHPVPPGHTGPGAPERGGLVQDHRRCRQPGPSTRRDRRDRPGTDRRSDAFGVGRQFWIIDQRQHDWHGQRGRVHGGTHGANADGDGALAPVTSGLAVDETTNVGERAQKMGRPSPGGEEARVVVYQPRGVGLMHSQHKLSDADYTHAEAVPRKGLTEESPTFLL
jgi:hypothetical protein